MKKERIKALPVAKEFINYFIRRGKKVLRLKNADFDHASIDAHPDRGTIWVWFYNPAVLVGRAQFTFDGRCYSKEDYRKGD